MADYEREETGEQELPPLRFDRRRHNNIKDWAVIITLVFNLAGLVWTAAKWSAAIDQLQISTGKLTTTLDVVVANLYKLDGRTTLLEYQVNSNNAKLGERK